MTMRTTHFASILVGIGGCLAALGTFPAAAQSKFVSLTPPVGLDASLGQFLYSMTSGGYTREELDACTVLLLAECVSELDRTRVYDFVAVASARSGRPEWAGSTLHFMELALALPLPRLCERQLQLIYNQAVAMAEKRRTLANGKEEARAEIARVLLEGLRVADENNLPAKSIPEDHRAIDCALIDAGNIEMMQLRDRLYRENQEAFARRREVDRLNKCINLRYVLRRELVSLYANEPKHIDELKKLGKEILGKPEAVESLEKAVHAEIDRQERLRNTSPEEQMEELIKELGVSRDTVTYIPPK